MTKKPKTAGAYGEYKDINGMIGVKILYPIFEPYKTLAELMDSDEWKVAKIEGELLRQAYNSGISPYFFRVTPIAVRDTWRAGIVMEHIEGTLYADYTGSITWDEVLEFVDNRLKIVGIYIEDLNAHNVIITPDEQIRVVDFSPSTTYFKLDKD
jgi:tRNA A-37 threonylcarbamoyl transferase component Bud32